MLGYTDDEKKMTSSWTPCGVPAVAAVLLVLAAPPLVGTSAPPSVIQKIHHGFGVIGILSVPENRALRDAQRETWLSDRNNNVIHRFLIDTTSPEMVAEHAKYKDIYFLHSKYV